jgi:hypothetical protein
MGYGTVAPASTTGGGNWFTRLPPEVQATLVGGGTSILGGVLAGIGQGKEQNENREFQAGQNDADRQLRAAQLALSATQGNPLATQQARQRMAVMGALLPGARNFEVTPPSYLKGYVPQTKGGLRLPDNGFDQGTLDFFKPETLANAEGEFWSQLAPFVNPPDLTKVGYGAAGQGATDRSQMARQAALQRALGPAYGMTQNKPTGPAPEGYEYKFNKDTGQWEMKKKGSSWWKKALKIGGLGALTVLSGGALAPYTGPVMAGVLAGAGVGALGGALDGGGWKGAALGAGLGAATGGLGGGAAGAAGTGTKGALAGFGTTLSPTASWGAGMVAPTLRQTAGSALTQYFKDPRTWAQIAGGSMGGPTGSAIQMGGNVFGPDLLAALQQALRAQSSYPGTPPYFPGGGMRT